MQSWYIIYIPVLQAFIMALEHECLVLSKTIFVFIMLSDECQSPASILRTFICFSVGKTFFCYCNLHLSLQSPVFSFILNTKCFAYCIISKRQLWTRILWCMFQLTWHFIFLSASINLFRSPLNCISNIVTIHFHDELSFNIWIKVKVQLSGHCKERLKFLVEKLLGT